MFMSLKEARKLKNNERIIYTNNYIPSVIQTSKLPTICTYVVLCVEANFPLKPLVFSCTYNCLTTFVRKPTKGSIFIQASKYKPVSI